MRSETILPRQVNRRIGQAMQAYSMLSHGDSVLVAVSGGVDSLVLAWVLKMWLQKAPISYTLRFVHVDMGFRREGESGANPADEIREQLDRFGIPLDVLQAGELTESERSCFLCARQRRHQLFELARESPLSIKVEKVGLCLPRKRDATSVAKRPRTLFSALTTYHFFSISLTGAR